MFIESDCIDRNLKFAVFDVALIDGKRKRDRRGENRELMGFDVGAEGVVFRNTRSDGILSLLIEVIGLIRIEEDIDFIIDMEILDISDLDDDFRRGVFLA